MAVASGAVFLQGEIAAGARILASHAMRRLEEIRAYDTSPFRTTWLGTGQPNDPYDSHTVTFV
jgi:predicted Rossmann fold nucleotide-binding protein DprA/Smf involved in DNA uptake